MRISEIIVESVHKGLNEFVVSGDGGNDGDDSLFNYAKMWYNGDLKTQRQVEKALQKSGLDIGENEDENGGAYISDISGDYYESWTAEDLEQGVAEGDVDEGYRVANQQIPGTKTRAQSAYYPTSVKSTVKKLDKPLTDQELARLSQLAGIKSK